MSLKTWSGALSFPGPEEEENEHEAARRRPRPRPRQQPSSPVAELVEPVLVDPEVVRELVQNGDADLVLELAGVGKSSSSGSR